MPKSQGQTDQVLKLKLPSSIVRTGWGRDAVAQGGKIPLEVWTHWVADGSEIDVTIKDLEGQVVETLKGHVVSDLFRALYPVTKPNKTGGMYFEAELKAHAVKAVGPKVKVGPGVQFKNLKWLDEKGQSELKEVQDGEAVLCQASVEGAPAGATVSALVLFQADEHNVLRVLSTRAEVQKGKIQFTWNKPFPKDVKEILTQSDLDKHGGKYYHPAFVFTLELWGVTAKSNAVPAVQAMLLIYEFSPGTAGKFAGKKISVTAPDGEKKEYVIPADGQIEVPKTKPGMYHVDESAIADLLR